MVCESLWLKKALYKYNKKKKNTKKSQEKQLSNKIKDIYLVYLLDTELKFRRSNKGNMQRSENIWRVPDRIN